MSEIDDLLESPWYRSQRPLRKSANRKRRRQVAGQVEWHCGRCQEWKPENQFYNLIGRGMYRVTKTKQAACIECQKSRGKINYGKRKRLYK